MAQIGRPHNYSWKKGFCSGWFFKVYHCFNDVKASHLHQVVCDYDSLSVCQAPLLSLLEENIEVMEGKEFYQLVRKWQWTKPESDEQPLFSFMLAFDERVLISGIFTAWNVKEVRFRAASSKNLTSVMHGDNLWTHLHDAVGEDPSFVNLPFALYTDTFYIELEASSTDQVTPIFEVRGCTSRGWDNFEILQI